ncbi:MAG: YczE/YyaS/YitT family protein, partial [Enterococcus viikkiensis]
RSMLGIGSLINTFLVGETISCVALLFQSWSWLQGNVYFSFLGFVIMALGTALYLLAELGSGPLEGLMFCVCDKLSISLQKGRIALDFFILTCGFLLGSSLGVGTIMAVFFLGPMIQGFLTFLQKINSLALFQRQKSKRLSE